MDIALESTSPTSRRNQGKLAEAIQSMNELNNGMDTLDLPVDPDAQATVTDFLDFTEYLPSDMIRSLTLIGNLDQKYCRASASVNELTKEYGALPSLPLDQRADPVGLRKQISENLGDAVSARTSAHAEALRMAENVDRHYNRAKNILAKLQDMLEKYPSSKENSPVVQKKSPVARHTPKITLRLGNEHRIRKHRAPRITVPGEVLAPYELDYESYGSSEDEEDEAITPRATPARRSLPGGRMGVFVFLTGDGSGSPDDETAGSEATELAAESVETVASCLELICLLIGTGTGIGVSVLVLFNTGRIAFDASGSAAGAAASFSTGESSRLRLRAGVFATGLIGVCTTGFLLLPFVLWNKLLIAFAASAAWRKDSCTAAAAVCAATLASFSRFAFFASFNFMPLLLNLAS